MSQEEFLISRKKVIIGAGVGLASITVNACSTYGKTPAPTPPTPGTAESLARTTDVPVGSGLIVGDTVLTQPTAGVFKGFSAVCTHAGCSVATIANGTIDCPCHGSKFNLDGTVANGPASRPLESKPVSVRGDSIILG